MDRDSIAPGQGPRFRFGAVSLRQKQTEGSTNIADDPSRECLECPYETTEGSQLFPSVRFNVPFPSTIAILSR